MISFSGLQVSKVGFGCGGLSGILNAPLSHEAGCSIIREAFSKGITFFDTADVYGENHDNEYMVGKVCFSVFNFQVQTSVEQINEYMYQILDTLIALNQKVPDIMDIFRICGNSTQTMNHVPKGYRKEKMKGSCQKKMIYIYQEEMHQSTW